LNAYNQDQFWYHVISKWSNINSLEKIYVCIPQSGSLCLASDWVEYNAYDNQGELQTREEFQKVLKDC
jgi:hypothetical protein